MALQHVTNEVCRTCDGLGRYAIRGELRICALCRGAKRVRRERGQLVPAFGART